jgi:predicted nuclease with TOPRIM domain
LEITAMSNYTKAQLIMHLTERDAEVKALHEKLGRLQLECAELRGQLRRTRLEASAEVKEMGDKLAEFAQKNIALEYEVKATKHEAPKTERPGYQEFKAHVAKRQRLMEACSRLSREYATTARIKNDVIELYSQRQSAWVIAPEFR